MRIGLIDVDGHNFPNLPLMKISAWHKAQGDAAEWYMPFNGLACEYDRVYMSKVFSFTPDYEYPIYSKTIIKGGSGYCIETIDGKEVYRKEKDLPLPNEVEHIYPDYSLYPDKTKDTAYGFLTRGCPRACGFCHVAAKEGRCSVKVADLSEFWRGQKNIVLSDQNILACRDHIELLEQLAESRARVEFNQGLDIRLVNDCDMEVLRRIKLNGIHFAFDRWEDREIIEPKLREFASKTGFNKDRGKVTVYILCNYDTTLEQDMYRIQLCRELRFAPYPMIYNKQTAPPVYRRLQRWCNNFVFWKVKTFEEYDGSIKNDRRTT